MPEIVELKIIARSLKDRLQGKTAFKGSYAKGGFDLNAAVEEKKLTDVIAHGKELFFRFDDKPAFSAHLMLHGGFNILNENLRPAAVDTVAEIVFYGDEYLMLYDPDGYAKVLPFDSLPDVPEATEITENEFFAMLARKKGAAIKNVLCDQKCVRGIGNAYADEILYAAKISPSVKAGNIPDYAKAELYEAMKNTLNFALEYYGKKYRGALGGEMRDLVKVHTRARMTPDGEIIKTCDIGGRKTYYAPSQRTFV